MDTVVSGGKVWRNKNPEVQPWLMVDLKTQHFVSFVVWTGVPIKKERAVMKKLFVKVGE